MLIFEIPMLKPILLTWGFFICDLHDLLEQIPSAFAEVQQSLLRMKEKRLSKS